VSTSAQDLIQDALEMLGIYSPGDSISAADSARTLFILNSMLDEWAGETIFVYQTVALTGPIASGTAQYTIAEAGATVTAPRPNRIAYGNGAASVTVGSTTTPVNVVSAIEYQSLSAYSPAPGTPDTLYYQPSYPQGLLNLLPTPNAAGTLTFAAWQPVISFPELSTEVTFAVGGLDAVRDNLAVAAKTYFRDAQIDPLILQRAAEAKDFLRYQGINSRATMGRFTLTTNPRKPD
jgi:hypothetical protein